MKPLLCFDIEGTGVDPALDRIVQIAWRIENEASKLLINPGRPIPQESIEVHGITDEMVKDAPTFKHVASALLEEFKGCDLLGFNLTNYDVPILWEEFYRCGIVWDLSDTRVLDAGTLFKRREERSLTAALRFYCDKELEGAHDALNDVNATLEVWAGQLDRYGLTEADRETLERESNYEEKRLDLAGKIVVGKDGRPTYTLHKVRGVAVEDDTGFAHWMLRSDFSANTKLVLRDILDGLYVKQGGELF